MVELTKEERWARSQNMMRYRGMRAAMEQWRTLASQSKKPWRGGDIKSSCKRLLSEAFSSFDAMKKGDDGTAATNAYTKLYELRNLLAGMMTDVMENRSDLKAVAEDWRDEICDTFNTTTDKKTLHKVTCGALDFGTRAFGWYSRGHTAGTPSGVTVGSDESLQPGSSLFIVIDTVETQGAAPRTGASEHSPGVLDWMR